jgi:glycosyltransferase involved in cell wall biosynthesis
MRILHIGALYYPDVEGGAESHLQQISERLVQRGHEVTVFTTSSFIAPTLSSSGHPRNTFEVINRVKVRRFRPHGPFLKCLNVFLRVRGSYRLLRIFMSPEHIDVLQRGPLNLSAIAAAVRLRPDIVAVHNWCHPTLGYYGSLVKAVTRAPLVGIPLLHTEEPWSHSQFLHTMLARCDAVAANTEHEKGFIETHLPGHQGVHVIGVGVDPEAFSDPAGARIRAGYGIGDAPVVGYVGRMQPTKGVIRLLEAMKTVWQSEPRAYLILAGRRFPASTSYGRDFQNALASLSARERSRVIHIDGFEEREKSSIFDAIDVFAMPSTAESFGIAYLEAWMCGKPVIGSRIGSTRCVVEDGVDGLLVDPHSAEEIASAVLRLVASPELSRRMGRAGYEKTRAKFTWDMVTDRLERIYRNLIGGSPRPYYASHTEVRL